MWSASTRTALYRFGNDAKEYVNFTNDTNDYELIVFWDGKPASKIRSSLVKAKATKFVSLVTNQNKTSSYLAENQKIFDEIAAKKKLNNPDKNASALTQYHILSVAFNPMVYGDLEFYGLSTRISARPNRWRFMRRRAATRSDHGIFTRSVHGYSVKNSLLIPTSMTRSPITKGFPHRNRKGHFENGCRVRYLNGEKTSAYCPASDDGKNTLRSRPENVPRQRPEFTPGHVQSGTRRRCVCHLQPASATGEYMRVGTVTVDGSGRTQSSEGGIQKGVRNVAVPVRILLTDG